MTLLELLRQELPKRGGWPEGALCVVQDNDGQVCFSSGFEGLTLSRDKTDWFNGEWGGNWSNEFYDTIADDHTTAIVTREQYEATGWNGEGLPPVGCEFEYGTHRTKAKCIGIGHHMIFASKGDPDDENGDFEEFIISILDSEFRPLRTEAERAIDEMVQLSGVSTGAAKILYDAGYRK